MEFNFSINSFLPSPITKITSEDVVIRTEPCFQRVIDDVGKASQIAQNLRRAVTSTSSFVGSNQVLYIMTNPSGNSGKGIVLGMLKVGSKKLFLLDKAGTQNELHPICILDFYIHESSQRMGLGKILFEYFLKDHSVSPVQVAIDRPSDKFIGFLQKHYGLVNIIPQVNNFVIYEGFFESLDTAATSKSRFCLSDSDQTGSNNFHTRSPKLVATKLDQSHSLKPCPFDASNRDDAIWQTHVHKAIEKPCNQNNPEIPTKFSHHRLW